MPIDQWTRIQRVAHAANLVLDRGKQRAGGQVGDVLEAVLALVALLRDQAASMPLRGGAQNAPVDGFFQGRPALKR